LKRLSLAAAVVFTMFGCATVKGPLPVAPTDAQLSNDGSEAEQKKLIEKYEVRKVDSPFLGFLGGTVVRVGSGDREMTEGILGVDTDTDLRTYLTTGGEPDPNGPNAAWRTLAFVGAGLVVAAPLLWLAAIVLGNGFLLFGNSVVTSVLPSGSPGFNVFGAAAPANALVTSALFLLIATGVVLIQVAQYFVERSIWDKVTSHNVRLRERIRANIKAPAGPAPPAATTPPAQPAPSVAAPAAPTATGLPVETAPAAPAN
jgi:hypothetical protein